MAHVKLHSFFAKIRHFQTTTTTTTFKTKTTLDIYTSCGMMPDPTCCLQLANHMSVIYTLPRTDKYIPHRPLLSYLRPPPPPPTTTNYYDHHRHRHFTPQFACIYQFCYPSITDKYVLLFSLMNNGNEISSPFSLSTSIFFLDLHCIYTVINHNVIDNCFLIFNSPLSFSNFIYTWQPDT